MSTYDINKSRRYLKKVKSDSDAGKPELIGTPVTQEELGILKKRIELLEEELKKLKPM